MLAVLFSLPTKSKAEVYISSPPVNIIVGSNDYFSGMQIDRHRQHRYLGRRILTEISGGPAGGRCMDAGALGKEI